MTFTHNWMSEIKRLLKPGGSVFVFSGWNNLKDILITLDKLGFITVNHLIWKYQAEKQFAGGNGTNKRLSGMTGKHVPSLPFHFILYKDGDEGLFQHGEGNFDASERCADLNAAHTSANPVNHFTGNVNADS
ncbi:MAG: hypothetical protein LBT46_09715 [Planctomycetaceae bacterium]|nr:hypothetical protein [Planctomycetaceae bacterium]